jgi:hypothetical protein
VGHQAVGLKERIDRNLHRHPGHPLQQERTPPDGAGWQPGDDLANAPVDGMDYPHDLRMLSAEGVHQPLQVGQLGWHRDQAEDDLRPFGLPLRRAGRGDAGLRRETTTTHEQVAGEPGVGPRTPPGQAVISQPRFDDTADALEGGREQMAFRDGKDAIPLPRRPEADDCLSVHLAYGKVHTVPIAPGIVHMEDR